MSAIASALIRIQYIPLTFWLHTLCIVHKLTDTLPSLPFTLLSFIVMLFISLSISPFHTNRLANPSVPLLFCIFLYLFVSSSFFFCHSSVIVCDILPLTITKHIHLHHTILFYMFVYLLVLLHGSMYTVHCCAVYCMLYA